MRNYYIALLIIVLIFIIYNTATWNQSNYEKYLYGFWTADGDDFCESSEIDSMLLFIGEPESGWFSTERVAYLIIMPDMFNDGCKLKYKRGWAGPSIGEYTINAEVEFDNDQIWDDCVDIKIDMRNGTMKIHNGDTIYALLNKQHETTNYCQDLADVELV